VTDPGHGRAGLEGALGVFGGTFDPIHVAHLAVAEAARDALGLRRVLFVPAARPPHKTTQRVTAAQHRLAMVEAAVADNEAFALSTIELERDGPSFTIDTLRALTAGEPAAGSEASMANGAPATGLALILSAEAFADFPTWRDPAGILALATLVVVPREGYPEADAAALARAIPAAREPRIVVLDGPRMQLSASELRARARAGRSLRYLVPDAVAAYIGDHALYRDQQQDETR
jgi:nicotinate-nucleotide adenylyltransferase